MATLTPLHVLFTLIVLYDLYSFTIFFYQSFSQTTSTYSPFISVIVPVYNGESTIEKCVSSILSSDYPLKEVIVVDDGSTDRTKEVVQSLPVTVYSIPHAGKASALNTGVKKASGDIVVIDADTTIEKDTLKQLVRTLNTCDAVAGNIQVSNRKGFLGRCQAIEHVRIAMFRKVAQYFDSVDIVPGPLGAFRREVFSKTGYGTSVVEDMELTQALRENRFTIGYEQEARAYTEMPSAWLPFLRQRFRWARGNMELVLRGKVPLRKVLSGYGVALADLGLVITACVTSHFFLVFLFFALESSTMLVGTQREKVKYVLESVFFPVFMLFLDFVFIFSYTAAFFFIASYTRSQENTPRT